MPRLKICRVLIIIFLGFELFTAKANANLSIQFSPILFFYGGYDVRIALKRSYIRYQVEIFKVDEAEYIDEDSPFSIETKSLGATLSIFSMDKDSFGKGPYLGIAYHRVRWDFFHPPSNLKLSRNVDFLGPLIGYQHVFSGSGFFMTGELRYQRNITSSRDLTVQGQTNEIPDYSFNPILSFGYAF